MALLRWSLLAALASACGVSEMDPGVSEGETFDALASLPVGQAGVSVSIQLCKPPKVVPGEQVDFSVSGLQPGETVRVLRGRPPSHAPGTPPTCYPAAGGLCTDLVNPVVLGDAVADYNGVATWSRIAPVFAQPGVRHGAQAFVRRGAGGSASLTSNMVLFKVLGSLGEPGDCGGFDVCLDLPDDDGDGVVNQCDQVEASPGSLSWALAAGEQTTDAVTMDNSSSDPVAYTASSTCAWLTVDSGEADPSSGTIPAYGGTSFSVLVDATGLAGGSYDCDVVVTTDSPVYPTLATIPATLEVTATSCFGEPLASMTRAGGIYDQQRITHSASHLFASWNEAGGTRMYQLDFNLNLTGVSVALPQAGNHGIQYEPVNDVIYNFDEARTASDVSVLSGDGSTFLAGPFTTGADTGGVFTDPSGNLHLVKRTAPGIVEMTSTLGVVGTWGTDGGAGYDVALSADGSTVYKIALAGGLTRYAFSSPGRPAVGTYAIPTVPGSAFWSLDVDAAGVVYVLDQGGSRVLAVDPIGGTVRGSFSTPPGMDPRSIDYVASEHAIYIAGYNGGVGALNSYCAW